MKKIFAFSLAIVLALSVPAMAQTPNDAKSGTAAVSATTSNVTFDNISSRLSLYNAGSETIFVAFCDTSGTCTATTANLPLYSGMTLNFDPFNAKRLAVICDTGLSSTLAYYYSYFNQARNF